MRSSIRAADQSCDVTVASFDAPPETCSSYDAMYFAWPDWCLEDVCMNDETVQKWKRRMEETQTIILPSHRGYFRVKEAASRAPVFVGYPYDIGPLKEATEIFDPSAVLEKYPFYESGTFSRTLVEDVRKKLLSARSETRIVAFSPARPYRGAAWPHLNKYFDAEGRGTYHEIEDVRVLERYHIRYQDLVMYMAKRDWDRYEGTEARREWERVGVLMADVDEQSLMLAADVRWIIGQVDERVFASLDSLLSVDLKGAAGKGVVLSGTWLNGVDYSREEDIPAEFLDPELTAQEATISSIYKSRIYRSERLEGRRALLNSVLNGYALRFVPDAKDFVRFDLLFEGLASSITVCEEEAAWERRTAEERFRLGSGFYGLDEAVVAWISRVRAKSNRAFAEVE